MKCQSIKKKKLRGVSPQANYTDRATAAVGEVVPTFADSQYYSKIILKCCLSNAEDGMQHDILWDDGEQSGEGTSSSENENARGLRHEMSSPDQTLGSWTRIPLEAWMTFCVSSIFVLPYVGSGLATGWPSSKKSCQLSIRFIIS
jgi:hypothetical protein